MIFPALRRQLGSGYASIFSSRFHQHLMAELGGQIRLGVEVSAVEPQRVQLLGGQSLEAGAVIDGRGVRRSAQLALGFQKFLGGSCVCSSPMACRCRSSWTPASPRKTAIASSTCCRSASTAC